MNKNKKYRFNIIDVFIILTVVAIGAVLYFYMSARNLVASNQDVEVEYIVEFKTVHRDYVDNIKVGDTVVETVREQQIGKVVDIVVSPAYNIATDTNTGEMFIQYYPVLTDEESDLSAEAEPQYEYYNVKVRVIDTLKKTDEGYKKNAFVLRVGHLVYFRVPEFVGEGFCLQIDEVDKEAESGEK